MAVNNPTTNYGWILPTEGASDGTWGTESNELIGDFVGAILSVDEILAGLQAELDVEQLRIVDVDDRTSQLEGSAPRPAYARVVLGSNQIVAKDVAEMVSWDTEVFDKNDLWALTPQPTRLTVPALFDGLYTVRGVVLVPWATGSGNDANAWYARIIKNGATVIAEVRVPYQNDNADNSDSGGVTLLVEALVDAVEDDYFEIEVFYTFSGSGSATLALLGGSSNSYFEMYRHRSPTLTIDPVVGNTATTFNSTREVHLINLPAVVNPGDYLLVSFCSRGSLPHTVWSAGWDQIAEFDNLVTTNSIYAKIADGTEGGGTMSVTVSVSRTGAAIAWSFDAATVDTTQPIEAVIRDFANPDCPAITPSWGPRNTLIIACVWCGDAPYSVDTTPAGYSGLIEVDNGLNNDAGIYAMTRLVTAATEDPDEYTDTGSGSDTNCTIAVPGAILL